MQKSIMRAAAIASAGLALSVVAPATAANAISLVSCNEPGAVRVAFTNGDRCFAEKGTINFVPGMEARGVSAGKNHISVGVYGTAGTIDVRPGDTLPFYRTLQVRVLTIH